jgi:sortase A
MRLRIPVLNLDAHVESVGLSGDAMDVPANAWDVAWFKLGPPPGMAGNAVIDGHLDTATGPAVFLHLGNLHAGDLLYVTTTDGVEHTFKVTALANYPLDKAPITRIFGASKGAHLNLITCSGDWLSQQHIYNERLVVYSTLVA